MKENGSKREFRLSRKGTVITMTEEPNRLYEYERFQTAAQNILRPGGLTLTKKAMDIAGLAEGSRILDVGCGCGKTVEYLKEKFQMQAMGIDISKKLIAKAKLLNSTLEVRVGDVCHLPYPDQAMDGVFCECAFSLFEYRLRALAEIKRVLKPSGKLIISDLYIREKTAYSSNFPIVTCINRIAARDILIQEITGAGFRLIEWQDETGVFKEFIAGLIMKYGLMTVGESLPSLSDKACGLQDNLKNVKIGYYLSVWQKDWAGRPV